VKTKKLCVKDLSSFPLKQQWLDRCGQMRSRADARDKEVLSPPAHGVIFFAAASAALGAVLIARPPRGWREVGARIAELIERRLLCPDDPALKGAPRLALVVRAQHLEHNKGQPLTDYRRQSRMRLSVAVPPTTT
jgi:hypothetical protein